MDLLKKTNESSLGCSLTVAGCADTHEPFRPVTGPNWFTIALPSMLVTSLVMKKNWYDKLAMD